MRGELATSITSHYDDNSAVVGTNKTYATIHQFGQKVGRNRKTEISESPYLSLEEKEYSQIQK